MCRPPPRHWVRRGGLIAVWTSMVVLARREYLAVSVRALGLAFTLAVGVTAALLAWSLWRRPQPLPSDLAPIWVGARALLDRQNPYEAVRPANPLSLGFPLMYPLTAVLALMPR